MRQYEVLLVNYCNCLPDNVKPTFLLIKSVPFAEKQMSLFLPSRKHDGLFIGCIYSRGLYDQCLGHIDMRKKLKDFTKSWVWEATIWCHKFIGAGSASESSVRDFNSLWAIVVVLVSSRNNLMIFERVRES